MVQACIFCGCKCFDLSEGAEEGYEGRRIGDKIICTGCLDNLKDALGIKQIEEGLDSQQT